MGRGSLRLISPLLLLVAWTANPPAAGASALSEYQVKAAFLYNFARFTEWPAEAAPAPGEPFAICVLGADPFGHSLDDVVTGQSVSGHPVEIRHIPETATARGCRILFAGASKSKRSIASAFRETGVLTVMDSDGQSDAEAMISFVLEGGRVRFEVNIEAAARGKLRLSSRLLSLAAAVKR